MRYHPPPIILRDTTIDDLPILFTFQTDKVSNYQAAFTSTDPGDYGTYMKKWIKVIENPHNYAKTIIYTGEIVGSITTYSLDNEREITYWLDRNFWGKSIATHSLKQYLQLQTHRPLHARVVSDNYASIKVLELNGFRRVGSEVSYAHSREKDVTENIYVLED